jgi:hypothetical protein
MGFIIMLLYCLTKKQYKEIITQASRDYTTGHKSISEIQPSQASLNIIHFTAEGQGQKASNSISV